MGPLDIIVSVMIGSNVSRALTGNAPLWGTLAATTLLLVVHWLLAHGASRFGAISWLVEGRACELARDGKLDHGARRRYAISDCDLHEALRGAGVEQLWLSSTPPLPDSTQAAARAKGGERYDSFLDALGRRLAKGPKLRQEIGEDIQRSS